MRSVNFAPALLLVAIVPVMAQLPEDQKRQFDEAERQIVRLAPAAFPNLPRNISGELERRGCRIPQEEFSISPAAKKRSNVVQGQFLKAGQMDWAVLCSIKGVSTILVFWNGSEKNPAAIAPMEDRIFLQGITAERIGYSRGIGVVGKDVIEQHFDAYGGPKPPPVDHQGIDDALIGKASETWYFYEGKWLKLTGSD
jgi:hypothetical protein